MKISPLPRFAALCGLFFLFISMAEAAEVTVTTTDAVAGEFGLDEGTFTVNRNGDTSAALEVQIRLSGTATEGTDYLSVGAIVTIPVGKVSALVKIQPLPDALAEGAESVTLEVLADASYTLGSPATATLMLADTPIDGWRVTHFPGQLGNAAVSGLAADPDHDGRSNLLEYAEGTSPLVPDTVAARAVGVDAGGRLIFTYQRAAGALDLRYEAESAGTDFIFGTAGVAEQPVGSNAAGAVWQATDAGAPTSAAARFMRLWVGQVGSLGLVSFAGANFSSYGVSQDKNGGAAVSDGGATVALTGTSWKKIPFPYNVTPDTILEFDFSSTQQAEFHGIGLEEDSDQTNSTRIFQIYGSTATGDSTSRNTDFKDYTPPGPKRYRIRVGDFYQGQMAFLVLVNDSDKAWTVGNGTFSNVRIYEGSMAVAGGDPTPPQTPSGVSATAVGPARVDLDWDDNTEGDLTGYEIYRSTAPSFFAGPQSLLVTALKASIHIDGGLRPGTAYFYRVAAIDAAGNRSPASAEVAASTEPATGAAPWVENFALADGTTADSSPTAWSVSGANMSVQGGKLVGNNTGSVATWKSEVIDLRNVPGGVVSLSADVEATGMQGTDTMTLSYILDGLELPWFSRKVNFPPETATAAGLRGSSLQIVATMLNNRTVEKHFLDNVSVTPGNVGTQQFTPTASSYLGGISDDGVRGSVIQPDGTIVLAAKVSGPAPGGLTATLLDGASASSPGMLVRLSRDGRTVLSVARVAANVRDLATDGAGNLYVTTGPKMLKLNPEATVLTWSRDISGATRVDAAPDGTVAVLSGGGFNDEGFEATLNGTVTIFDAAGVQLGQFSTLGGRQTYDVAIDSALQSVFTTGFLQTTALDPAPGATGSEPVQISYLRSQAYDGTQKWKGYDWPARAESNGVPNEDWLNEPSSNMADSRGLRLSMGLDGNLYVAFQVAGGNHIFRYDPFDIDVTVPIVGGDNYHQFFNSKSENKTFFARYDAATGAYLLGQQFCGRLSTSAANAARPDGDIKADAVGRVYLSGSAASGLPITFLPPGTGTYTGGGFLLVMSPDFRTRLLVTRFAGNGKVRTVSLGVEAEGRQPIVFGGTTTGGLWNWNPVQGGYGGGAQDGFFGVFE